MARPKRSVWAFLLLAMISLPGSLFLYRKVQQAAIRHKMEKKLEHALLQTIELKAGDVQWFKPEKEIVVDNRLFDVKSYHAVPGTDRVAFTGLFDEEETDVVRKLSDMLQKGRGPNADKRLTLAVFIFACPAPSDTELQRTWKQLETISYRNDISSLPAADLSTPSPPPKKAFAS